MEYFSVKAFIYEKSMHTEIIFKFSAVGNVEVNRQRKPFQLLVHNS